MNVVSGQVVTSVLALEHVGGLRRTDFSADTQRFIRLMEQIHRQKLAASLRQEKGGARIVRAIRKLLDVRGIQAQEEALLADGLLAVDMLLPNGATCLASSLVPGVDPNQLAMTA